MVRHWLPRGTMRRDVAIAAVCLAGGLVMFAIDGFHSRPAPAFVPLLAICVAVGLRRVATLAALGIGVAALAAELAVGGSLAVVLIFTQVLYDACTYGPPWLWRWLLRVGVGLTAAGTAVAVALTRDRQGLVPGVAGVLILVVPVLTGITVRQYRDQAAIERARAEQTARLAELDRRQAVLAERTRMARELHDVIANHLSAVAVHATAAQSMTDLNTPAVRDSLQAIRENSVQGLAEMRQMIELLRDPADASPSPADPPVPARLAELDRLVEQARRAGLRVRLAVAGDPQPLPVAVDLAAYRILQESLTNALKHGTGQAEVTVAYESDRVRVTVDNPVPDRPDGGGGLPGAGAGLVGMRERAELLRGTLRASRHGSGWRVHADLPMEPTPA